jgi:hypothetical protein
MNADNAPRSRKSLWFAAAVLGASASLLGTANAQFGMGFGQRNLPANDFTWTWGNARAAGRGIDDLSVIGNEAGFRCNLTGKLSVGSRMSRMDMRSLESRLRGQIHFIQAAANTMADLEAQGEIDWAKLECVKPKRENEH